MAVNDPAWQVERFGYDAYGNQSRATVADTAGSPNRWTQTGVIYPPVPGQDDAERPEFAETASYYGVNAVVGPVQKLGRCLDALGAMAEWCDVNGVRARQGMMRTWRRLLAWEKVVVGAGWASNTGDNATVLWDYR